MGLMSKSSKSGQINYPAWVKTDPKLVNAHNNKYSITGPATQGNKKGFMHRKIKSF